MNHTKQLFITQLRPDIYLMDEAHEASGYIVVGGEKVCVIDTMNGYNDLHKAVREITDKPIVVVNTHGHPDHIFGNIYFEEAYMNPADNELAAQFVNIPEFAESCRKYGLSMPPFKPIKGGDLLDLGGKTLEVYEIPGHTRGSILLRKGAVEICGGKTENDSPYKWFGGVDMQHPFALEDGKQYSQADSVICYRAR